MIWSLRFGTLFGDGPVEGLKNDGHKVVTLGAFDLLEGLDVFVLGAVHNGENLRDEVSFIPGPMATGACI